MSVAESVEVRASAAALWDYVTDWPRNGEWIPLTRVTTLGGDARGVGGRFHTWTGIGPIGFTDPLTVTSWEPRPDGSGRCSLVHTGRVVRGEAEIDVEALDAEHSRLRWAEYVDLGRLGTPVWRVAGPLVRRGLRLALRRLAARVERGG